VSRTKCGRDWLYNVADRYLKISVAGQELKGKKSKLKSSFVGIYTVANSAVKVRRFQQIIVNYLSQYFPCPYNPPAGKQTTSLIA
jgi:hypothetical protein